MNMENALPQSETDLHCCLAVVGSGLAGSAAALFAARRGVDTVRIGAASQILFASGFVDLLGVHPVETGTVRENPWEALRAVARDLPRHPYARIHEASIRAALEEWFAVLEAAGLSYRRDPERNTTMFLPVGTVKPTYAVPVTVWPGVEALRRRTPCLFVGIRKLRGFSALQLAATLGRRWPRLDHATVAFPGTDRLNEVYAEPLARSLALADNREALAAAVRPLLGAAQAVGFPAILGLRGCGEVVADMARRIGRPVFEIPTMPPAVAGLRIQEAVDDRLAGEGVRSLFPHRVRSVECGREDFVLEIGDEAIERRVHAKAVILATGRFVGRGLAADQARIRETLLDLPVYQPPARRQWHRRRFLDPRGHPINQAGLEIDDAFRPLDEAGRPVHPRLFAAGTILAHQDWMRMKCGTGLALASAWAAVQSLLERVPPPRNATP